MNSRERWLACMHFQPVDHVPDQEFGYWEETLPVWHAQGLPEYVDSDWKADVFFGFESQVGFPVNLGIIPAFEPRVLEEDDEHKVIIDGEGATKIIQRSGASTIPRYLKFPIETRTDWEEFKKRLDPADAGRCAAGDDWEKWKTWAPTCDKPLVIFTGSLFGAIRNWMGFENVAIAGMDQPDWIEEMVDYLAEFCCQVIRRAVTEVKPDYAAFWEDIAFNHGPIISPALFRRFVTPRYKRITDLLRSNGCDLAVVDCDGNINSLVEPWLAGGVNIMFPLEVRGGTDAFWMREKFGHEVRLAGGVDKIQLARGREAIDAEIERIRPLVEDGGCIPHVDHRCPPDVSYENYLYYLKRKREVFGIPEPAPWEERRELYEWAKA